MIMITRLRLLLSNWPPPEINKQTTCDLLREISPLITPQIKRLRLPFITTVLFILRLRLLIFSIDCARPLRSRLTSRLHNLDIVPPLSKNQPITITQSNKQITSKQSARNRGGKKSRLERNRINRARLSDR